MSEFGKKLVALAVVSLVMFGVFAAITYVKVNSYDLGEVVTNSMQALVAGLAILVANAARSVFAVVVISLSLVTTADAGLLNFFRLSRNVQSACANGQCGIKAVKPMPAKPSATKPMAPVAPLTNEQKRAAFDKAVREGRYGEILTGNDFVPGGSDFDGPVDYIPVKPIAPKPAKPLAPKAK